MNIISVLSGYDEEGNNVYHPVGYTTNSQVVAKLLRYNLKNLETNPGMGSVFRIMQVYSMDAAHALKMARVSMRDITLPDF